MSIDAAEFRRVLGHFPTGITVVTSADTGGRPVGLTVSSFCSLSLAPPLVLACIEKSADSHDAIAAAGVFAVNVLPASAERLSRRFATLELPEKFDGVPYREEVTGAPVLEEALAWVDCRLHAIHDGGDHTIFVGRVLAGGAVDGAPLVYYRGGYGTLGF